MASTIIPYLILFFIGLLSFFALISKEASNIKDTALGEAVIEEEIVPTSFYDIKKVKTVFCSV